MPHVCFRQKLCCCSDFKSLWRAAVSPECTCAWLFAEHCLHQVRYDTVVIYNKLSLLHSNIMCAYDHHSTRSGEVFLSQIWSVSTTPFASTPPQSSKNSPVKELVIMSRCACVFHMHVRIHTCMGILYTVVLSALLIIWSDLTRLSYSHLQCTDAVKGSWRGSSPVVRWVVTSLSLQCWSFHHCWLVLCACVHYRTSATGWIKS